MIPSLYFEVIIPVTIALNLGLLVGKRQYVLQQDRRDQAMEQ